MRRVHGTFGGMLVILLLAALAILPAADAGAQTPAGAGVVLQDAIYPGLTVWITDSSGRETRTRVVEVADDVLTTTADGTVRRIPAPEIVRIRARRADSLIDGALIGAGAAVASGLFLCSLTEPLANCRDDVGPMVRVGALGAAIGIGVDAMIRGRKTIYRTGGRAVSLQAAPIVARRALGLHLSVGF